MRKFCSVVILAAVLAGCGGDGSSESPIDNLGPSIVVEAPAASGTYDFAPPQNLLPPLPTEHAGSVIAIIRDGKDTYDRNAGTDFVNALMLQAAPGEFSWAIWQLGSEEPMPFVELDLHVPVGNKAYLALADYSRGRWEILAPVYSQRVLPLDLERHVSPAGNIYVALLLFDDMMATMDGLSLLDVYENQPPVADFRVVPSSGEVPLTVQLNARDSSDPDSDNLKYLWDFQGDGVFDVQTADPEISHEFLDPGAFNVRLIVIDENGEIASHFAELIAVLTGNNPPVAIISPSTLSANLPLNLVIWAGGSNAGGDPGDQLVKYELDLAGDGDYELTSLDAHFGGFLFSGPQFDGADIFPTLRVTDEVGNQATAVGEIHMSMLAVPQTIDSGGPEQLASHAHALAVINGQPAIAYSDVDGHFILFRRADDAFGGLWLPAVEVVSFANPEDYWTSEVSLAEVAGHPAICYADHDDGVFFIRSGDAAGSTWESPPVLIAEPYAKLSNSRSLAVIDGVPAVVFVEQAVISYRHASTETGSSWSPAQFVAAERIRPSLAEVQGNPAIVCEEPVVSHVYYMRAADGHNWDGAFTVEIIPQTDYISEAVLAVVDGNPAIVCTGTWFSSPTPLFFRALDPLGATWGNDEEILPGGGGSAFHIKDLQVIGGVPVICWSSGGMRFIRATDSAATSWSTPILLDSVGSPGVTPSLCEVQGQPALCYRDWTTSELKYMRGQF